VLNGFPLLNSMETAAFWSGPSVLKFSNLHVKPQAGPSFDYSYKRAAPHRGGPGSIPVQSTWDCEDKLVMG